MHRPRNNILSLEIWHDRKYEYATDKIYNLVGYEGNKYRPHCYWVSHEMSDEPKYFVYV